MKINNQVFLVLDIETSTLFENKDPIAVWLSYGYINLYSIKNEKLEVNYFRTFEKLEKILFNYSIRFYNTKIICYVHNLSYEFDFLIKNICRPMKILSNKSRHIIESTLQFYENIDFRCSYLLSGYSLRKIGEIVNLPKLESEYRCIYPDDEVTKEEKEYCCRDCDIVAKYIVDIILKEYGFLSLSPYTKTGKVRVKLKEFYKELEKNPDWDLMPDNDCYNAMCKCFNGGLCFSNPLFTNLPLKNVHSYDITSSYPYVMLKEIYPYTIKKSDKITSKFFIAKVAFKNIRSKYNWGFLSVSKMEHIVKGDEVYFNGKLISSDYIERYITNVDLETINLVYNYDSIEYLEFYNCEKYNYLPKPIISTIEHYATKKGELKDKLKKDPENTDLQREYMLAKNDFNSIYGMMVQKLIQPEYIIDENFNWIEKDSKYSKDENKHMKRNFLFGIYVTAYARRNLIRAIIKNCPYTLIYTDTDSIKYIGEDSFIDTNEKLFQYKDNKYIKNLGKFDKEKDYLVFKTLGAKKYCYLYNKIYKIIKINKKEKNKLNLIYKVNRYHLTVAGLPKRNYSIKNINDFSKGKEFNECKLATKYTYENYYFFRDEDGSIIEKTESKLKDFYKKNKIKTKGGVMLYPTSYILSITKNDEIYLNQIKELFEFNREVIKSLINIDINDYIL